MNSDVLLAGTTTANATDVGCDVNGLVMVIDTSNHGTRVLEKLVIPGIGVPVTGISVTGELASL